MDSLVPEKLKSVSTVGKPHSAFTWLIQVELLLDNLEATMLIWERYETPDVTALAIKSIGFLLLCNIFPLTLYL